MANYLLTKGKFQPFTYQELLLPALMATLAHQALELEYSNLSSKASIWKKLANDERDKNSEAYARYLLYYNDFKSAANELSDKGLQLSSRKSFYNLRDRYSEDIIPIEEAYNKRAKDAEIQAQNKLKGIVYDTTADFASLDDYIKNPNILYQAADSNAGYKRVYTAALSLSKELLGWGRSNKDIDPYTRALIQRHGYTRETVNLAIRDILASLNGQHNERGDSILMDILNQEMKVSGVNNWTNKLAINDYYNRVAPGLYGAVGQTIISPFANLEATYNLNHSNSKKGILPDYSKSRVQTNLWASPKAKKDFEYYSKAYFTKDGKITPLGIKVYNEGVPESKSGSLIGLSHGETYQDMSFRKWVNDNLLPKEQTTTEYKDGKKIVTTKTTVSDINKGYAKISKIENKTDASGRMSYRLPLSDADGKALISKIKSSIGEKGEIGEVNSIDVKNNKFTTDGNLSYNDLNDRKAIWEDYVEGVGRVAVLDNGKIIPVPENIGGVNRNLALKIYSEERKKAEEWLNNSLVEKAIVYLYNKVLSGQSLTKEEELFKNKYLKSYDVFHNLDRIYDLMAPDLQTSNTLEILIGNK